MPASLRVLQAGLMTGPGVFVLSACGPGRASCVLWAFIAALLKLICSTGTADCAPCVLTYFSMVVAVSAADGRATVKQPSMTLAVHFAHP